MKVIKLLSVLLIIGLMTGCNRNEIFFGYQTVPPGGWNKDSLLTYNIDVNNSLSKFNIYVHVRHYGNYPYQNLWLFLDYKRTKDSIPQQDTIECYLADEYGKWLGNGVGAITEMPVLFKKQIQWPDSGTYQIRIRHGMRDSVLTGINKVGIRVEKAE